MDDLHRPLLELQDLDRQIGEAETHLQSFGPRLESVEAPARNLERELTTLKEQLAKAQHESRRLERAAEEKRERLKKYEERLEKVRNVREESAVRTEIDLVRRATEADEQDAMDRMDEVRRLSLKASELEKRYEAARAQVEPESRQVLEEQQAAESALEELRTRRKSAAEQLPQQALRLYDRVRVGRSFRAVVPMLPNGACGFCHSTLPIQEQSQVRRGDRLYTCEVCGVILYAED